MSRNYIRLEDLDGSENGLIQIALRAYRKKMERGRKQLLVKFGDTADVSYVDAQIKRIAALEDKFRAVRLEA